MKTFCKYYGMNAENQFVFIPADSEAFKKMIKLAKGEPLQFENWRKRSIGYHRRYFALINKVIYLMPEQLMEKYGTIDKLRYQLMLLSGNCDFIINADGSTNFKVHSIEFKSMKQEKFQQVYSDCFNSALKHFLKDISKEDFEKELLNLC